mgnify:CR=1 FL=1
MGRGIGYFAAMNASSIPGWVPAILRTAAVVALVSVLPAQDDAAAKGQGWIQMFNGRDLSGWTPKIKGYAAGENFGDTFRVVDGLLTVNYEHYDAFDRRFGHLFYKTEFSNYRLRAEYRFVGPQVKGGRGWAFRNSGLMIHGQPVATMGKDQDFPVSIEVQLLGGRAALTGGLPTCPPQSSITLGVKNEQASKRCNDWARFWSRVHPNLPGTSEYQCDRNLPTQRGVTETNRRPIWN